MERELVGMARSAVLYARISTQEQSEGYSIDAQLKFLREYARKKKIKIIEELTEIESAKNSRRPVFKAMVDFVKKENITIILTEKTDRLYRNIKDYVDIDELMEELDLEVHLVKENEVLSKNSSSHQKFIHGIKVLIAKNFIDNLKEETKKGLTEKAEQGIFPGYAPLGYINNTDEKKLEVDSERASFIPLAFRLYAEGDFSFETLTDELYQRGLRTRKGLKVTKRGIQTLLKNPIYHGYFLWGRKLYKGRHKSLIDKRLFDIVQTIMADKNTSRLKGKFFTFKKVLKCGYCGHAITAEIQKDRYIYYRCSNSKRCKLNYYREEEIYKIFEDAVGQLRMTEEIKAWIKEALVESHRDEEGYVKEKLKKLNQEYKKNERKKHEIYNDKLEGIISKEFFLDKYNELQDRQSAIRAEISSLEKKNDNYIEEGMMILRLADNLKGQFRKATPEQRAKLLSILFSKCKLKNEGIVFCWNKPFDYLYQLYERNVRGE